MYRLIEVNKAMSIIKDAADPEANIIFGHNVNEELGESIKITVVATGFGKEEKAAVNNTGSNSILKTVRSTRPTEQPKQQEQAVVNAQVASEDYSDIPAYIRTNNSDDHTFPAFLRRGNKR